MLMCRWFHSSSREIKAADFPHAAYARSDPVAGLNLTRYAMAVSGDTLFVHGGRVTTQEESLGTLLGYHLNSNRWE